MRGYKKQLICQNLMNCLINKPALMIPAPKSSKPTMLQSFHPFPRLPYELRLLIWELALPESRVINVYDPNLKGRVDLAYSLAMTQVNREARRVVLKHYRWVDKAQQDPRDKASVASSGRGPRDRAGIFFNSDTDVVFYDAGGHTGKSKDWPEVWGNNYGDFAHCWYLFHRPSLEIKQLCVSTNTLYGGASTCDWCLCQELDRLIREGFPNLEKLWLWDGDDFVPMSLEEMCGEVPAIPRRKEGKYIAPGMKLEVKDLKLEWQRVEAGRECPECGEDEHGTDVEPRRWRIDGIEF